MNSSKRSRIVGTVLSAAMLMGGCHSMRFDVAPERSVSEVVYDRKAFFLGGLAPTRDVVLTDHCPHGVVAVREERTFVDGLLSLVTLSLYTPRSSWYECAAEEAAP